MTQCAVFPIISQTHGHNIQDTSTTLSDDRGKRSPTSRLHTDCIKVIGWVREIVAAGEAERYANPGNFFQGKKGIKNLYSRRSPDRVPEDLRL